MNDDLKLPFSSCEIFGSMPHRIVVYRNIYLINNELYFYSTTSNNINTDTHGVYIAIHHMNNVMQIPLWIPLETSSLDTTIPLKSSLLLDENMLLLEKNMLYFKNIRHPHYLISRSLINHHGHTIFDDVVAQFCAIYKTNRY